MAFNRTCSAWPPHHFEACPVSVVGLNSVQQVVKGALAIHLCHQLPHLVCSCGARAAAKPLHTNVEGRAWQAAVKAVAAYCPASMRGKSACAAAARCALHPICAWPGQGVDCCRPWLVQRRTIAVPSNRCCHNGEVSAPCMAKTVPIHAGSSYWFKSSGSAACGHGSAGRIDQQQTLSFGAGQQAKQLQQLLRAACQEVEVLLPTQCSQVRVLHGWTYGWERSEAHSPLSPQSAECGWSRLPTRSRWRSAKTLPAEGQLRASRCKVRSCRIVVHVISEQRKRTEEPGVNARILGSKQQAGRYAVPPFEALVA